MPFSGFYKPRKLIPTQCYGFQVSIYGHSLGSVLSYDILCHQKVLSSPFPMGKICKEYGLSGDAVFPTTSSSESSYGACLISPFVAETEAPEQVVNSKESNSPKSHLEPVPPEGSKTLDSVEERYVVRPNEVSTSDGKDSEMNHGLESICEQSSISDAELNRGSEAPYVKVMEHDVFPTMDDKDKLIASLAMEVRVSEISSSISSL